MNKPSDIGRQTRTFQPGSILPETVNYRFQPSPEGKDVEFRLLYKGSLPSPSSGDTRNKDKHRIRRYLHPQLAELWNTHPHLSWQLNRKVVVYTTPSNLVSYPGPGVKRVTFSDAGEGTFVEHVANLHRHNGYRFVPLLREEYRVTCALDILFLRRDSPGRLIHHGGDIDNRVKVLFDALRMPKIGEVPDGPQPGEDPFFCLLEDDQLITDISITTDRLLLPMEQEERANDVELVILVKTRVTDSDAFLAETFLP